jgi:pyruvate formate lyase activating enzyme
LLIGGFQKFSLLEYPGKIGAVIFTRGCNFRCPYCHNPELVDPQRYSELISEESVLQFLANRKGKLESVTISGGEPTLQPDLIDFALKLKELGYCIKLDTNGSKPEVIKQLINEKVVNYWAMDIKAPLSLYSLVTGHPVCDKEILKSMDLIRNSGAEWEFRTTYFNQLLNWNDILEIQPLLKPGDRYYLQQCNYENTLEPIQNPHQTNLELLFSKDDKNRIRDNSHHYRLLNESGKLQQIIIRMR